MAQRTMSNPTVIVNNDVIPIVPGSLSYNDGFGEITVRVGSNGGRSKELYYSEDSSTQKGMVKFNLITSENNVELLKTWLQLSQASGNTIQIVDGSFSSSFSEMYVINNPEINTGPDGEIEINFEGRGSF